jgi:hydroxymethylpyrimidine pyrophosphatase-like HAD family hydrolase/energy-coupling factor transporter ATP-binding protein EcfA2
MLVHVFAVDYDGTIADGGRVTPATAAALARVRESGRKLVLVTGRMLPDLRTVCPGVDTMFDAVVAENGAVLYHPARRQIKALGDAPEPALVEALQRREVEFALGTSIVATVEAFAEPALAAVRDSGVERTLVFNKGSLMLLPGGITKGTGLLAALDAMQLSPHNTVGVGDAENDHAFLALCEGAVAVADAVPALRERADHVTRGRASAGVIEVIEEHVLRDGGALLAGLPRHRLQLGVTADGEPATIAAHGTRLLIVGPSASGKSTLTGVLVETLVESDRTLCLLDPEGDHEGLAELPGVVVLGGRGRQTLPTAGELQQLIGRPGARMVLNLGGLGLPDKVAYATQVLGAVAAARATSGLPHWLIVDEAHHVAPADGSSAAELLEAAGNSLALITLQADHLALDARRTVTALASTNLEAFHGAQATLAASAARVQRVPDIGAPLARGEAALAVLAERPRRTLRFRVARRQARHRRHVRKYAEGELPPDRSFYFRGPQAALNLRAANLKRFCELAEGVDDATWTHHLRRRDYSTWIRDMIKDDSLADEVARVEENRRFTPAESRRLVLDAIRRQYAV